MSDVANTVLQSVSDFSTANPVVKGHWITVLENLIGSILVNLYTSLLKQHSKCELITHTHEIMKGFLLPDSMAFYTCPALERDNRENERALVNSILDLEIPQEV